MEQKLNNSGKARNMVFTWNNYQNCEYENCLKKLSEDCKYLVYGFEVGESGTPHLQGYVELKNPRSYKALNKEYFCNSAYFEKRKGTAKQASDYCKKDGDFKEFGEISSQGERKDIDIVKEMINEGKSMREICQEANSYQSIKTAEKLLSYVEVQRDFKPEVIWLYGKTGTGKTRKAVEMCGDNEYWMSGKDLKWWDGYDRHEYVIIDDYRKDFCKFHELLRILDRYPYRIEVKGGSRQLVAKYMIFTCPFHPEKVWESRTDEDLKQLLRRIDKIIEIE